MDDVYGFDQRKSSRAKDKDSGAAAAAGAAGAAASSSASASASTSSAKSAVKAAAKKEAAAAALNLKHLKLVDIPPDKELQRIQFHRDVVCATIHPYLPIHSPEVPPIFNHESLQLLRLDVQNDARGYLADGIGIALPALRTIAWFGNGIHDARLIRPGWAPGQGTAAPRLEDGNSWINAILALIRGTKKLRHLRMCQMNPPCNPAAKTAIDDMIAALATFSKPKRLAHLSSLHLEGWHAGGGWDMVLSLSENALPLAKMLPVLENLRLEVSPFELNTIATILMPFTNLRTLWISVARSSQSTINQRDVGLSVARACARRLKNLELIKVQSYVPVTGSERDEKLITMYFEIKDNDDPEAAAAAIAAEAADASASASASTTSAAAAAAIEEKREKKEKKEKKDKKDKKDKKGGDGESAVEKDETPAPVFEIAPAGKRIAVDITDLPDQWNTAWFFAEASDLTELNPMMGLTV